MHRLCRGWRGPEATQKIRALGYTGVIVGVTGNVLEEDTKEFRDLGADAVLPKPFELQ
jgi:CheY-like chemotaxis protein